MAGDPETEGPEADPYETSRRSLEMTLRALSLNKSQHAVTTGCDRVHTRLGDANLDVTSHKRRFSLRQGGFKAVEGSKLDIAKALGLAVKLVLDNADVSDLAVGEETFNVDLGNIVGKVAEMCGVRRLVWKGQLLAHRIARAI